MAGIINLSEQEIKPDIIQRFNTAMVKVYKEIECPWKIQKVNLKECILACADTNDMWEGARKMENSDFAAIATGVQWKRIPLFNSTLEYLATQFAYKEPKIEDYFDYFSCAIIDKKKNRCILATDPLGISQVVYYVDDTTLVFSSHQSFTRHYLGFNITICWNAVFEYLLIRHLLGNKTLMEGVRVLPPGCRLEIQGSDCRITPYTKIEDIQINSQMRVEEACELIWSYLDNKFYHYASLAKKDFIALLSGGWDTRLIAAFLARTGRLRETFTTEQGVKIGGKYVREGKIAKEVARLIGAKNYFIADRKQEDLYKLGILNDYTNRFHGWVLSVSEALPQSECIISDGFIGDLLIQGFSITDKLQKCIGESNKEKAVELILADYTAGIEPAHGSSLCLAKPDAESWKQVLLPEFISDSIEDLKQNITNELQDIHCENFITPYVLRNRSRRCINWLPIAIFGRKGTVILPFCDQKFIEIALAIPNEMKLNQSLYKCVLEKTKSGLSNIPSTNTKDIDKLQPYFAEERNEIKLRKEMLIKKWFQKKYPKGYDLTGKIKRKMVSFLDSAKKEDLILKETLEDPPTVLMDIFSADLKKTIRNHNKERIKNYRRYLRSILPVERFLAGKI